MRKSQQKKPVAKNDYNVNIYFSQAGYIIKKITKGGFMRVTIKRIIVSAEDETSFMSILETLKANRGERGEKIISLNKGGAYKSHLSISGRNHNIIKKRIYELINKKIVLDGDIIITNNESYTSCFSVIKGKIVNTI